MPHQTKFDFLFALRGILFAILLIVSSSIFGQANFFTFTQILTDSIDNVDGLNGVNATAVSPDGKHLYAVAEGDFSISLFRRNISTGELTFQDIWRDDIGDVEGLDGAKHLVISPDGKNVYIAAANDRTVTVFNRNATSGSLAFNQTFDLGAEGSGDVVFLAISPDGRDIFAATDSDCCPSVGAAIAHFRRDVTTGKLTWEFLYQDGETSEYLRGISAIAVSQDGKNVYVTSRSDSALTVFSRESSNSELHIVETEIHRSGADDGLAGPTSVLVSPDGNNVYTISSSSIATYSRNTSTGEIDFVEIDSDNVNGVEGMSGAIKAVINANGTHIFVTASYDDSLTVFEREPQGGKLEFIDFIDRGDLGSQNRDALSDAEWLSISPDGAYLHVSNNYYDSIGVFKAAIAAPNPQKFQINPGLNGSWFYPATAGQGFLIDVFPDSGQIFLAWFTYDTELPAEDAPANLGNAGQRWMTALGSYSDNQAVLDIYQAEGGLFDMSAPAPSQTKDGTVIVEFSDCNSGTITYDIPSIDREGVIPIQRIALDNVGLCEALQ
jgi:6-phosphogluconolactonase (cycloisomerase 2 family)